MRATEPGARRAPARGRGAHDHYDATDPDILDRWAPVADWQQRQSASGAAPGGAACASPPGRRIEIGGAGQRASGGINLARHDALSLAGHPRILAAAEAAMRRYGVHSAGSSTELEVTSETAALERAMADFTGYGAATVFPSGWGAGYGALRALVRPDDHVVIDSRAHSALQEGAQAATTRVHRFPHLSTDGVARRLERLRAEAPGAGILVVTEALFAQTSDSPHLGAVQALCRRHRARLLVGVVEDLGTLGPTGRGVLERQGMLGEVDLIVGSFSRTFASGGGFVASNHPGVRAALRMAAGPLVHSTALSPVQAAVVLAAMEIVSGPEGAGRRRRLGENVMALRSALTAARFQVPGEPSAVVPVRLGGLAAARALTAAVRAGGAIVTLTEPPQVAQSSCRWLLHPMADQSTDDMEAFAALARQARAD